MESAWEYKIASVSTGNKGAMQMNLNQMGSTGWEVVGFAAADKTIGLNEYTVVLKRRTSGFEPPANTKPGWNPDPTGRHQLRWWDGLRWEASVNDDGANSIDYPIPQPSR